MIRATGRYQQQTLKLDAPVELEEGARVVVEITLTVEAPDVDADWSDVGMTRLEEEWNSSSDAIYGDWRTLYGVPAR